LGDDMDDMTRVAGEVVRGLLPSHPYMILGQHSVSDPTRAPSGEATLWGYTHVPPVPRGDADDSLHGDWTSIREAFADRIEERIEALAPGFRSLVKARRILSPPDFERDNPNLVGGEHGGGTMQAHQMLVFRPVPGWFRYRTPVKGLYLASASAHPGGAVHGACGAGAARMALRDGRFKRI
jgi:phytoene dehydrogenase-like protein